ncbi:MAG TPA: YraN family protein [Firmicutes bacterium]|nr:YraN family protein [Bacillota bacterium]
MGKSRDTGFSAEEKAASYLTKKGYRILERNYTTPMGEIDIVAQDRDNIVFCEVKYRRGTDPPSLEIITAKKQKKIIKAAHSYIRAHEKLWTPQTKFRFDAIGLSDWKIIHIEGAFYEC